jgi:hypothetical protein
MTNDGVLRFKRRDKAAQGAGHPVLFGVPEAWRYDDFPDGGGYPIGFLERASRILGISDPTAVLHVCSGSVRTGLTVDVRETRRPRVVADGVWLPFRDDAFQWVLADPPYSQEYAANLYGTAEHYPSPHVLAMECLRVLKPGGRLGFMHHMVPKFTRPGRLLKVYGISQGPGYNIRAWTVMTKDHQLDALPLAAAPGASPAPRDRA